MIIWGSSSAKLKEKYSVSLNCNACNSNNFILHGIQKYGHIWFLPLFPGSKIFSLTCEKCSATLHFEHLDQLGDSFEKMKFKTPMTSYLGWIIIGVILPLIVFQIALTPSSSTQSNKTVNYLVKNNIDSIEKNDFLLLDSKEKKGYIIARVLDIDNGQYTLKFSKYVYKRKMSAEDEVKKWTSIFNNDFYTEDYYDLTMKQIRNYFEIKEVVTRKDLINRK